MKRSFDDQTQVRIYLETTAIDHILEQCRFGIHDLIGSDSLIFENDRNPNPLRKQFASLLIGKSKIHCNHDYRIAERALEWQSVGIDLLDSLHLASAEKMLAEVFLTSDDRLQRRAVRKTTSMRICNPVEFIKGEFDGKHS